MPADVQDLDKKDAVAEKQRESMMVGLSKTKSELGSLQDALAKTQVELEKTNFELHAKKSKHMSPISVLGMRQHNALKPYAMCADAATDIACSMVPVMSTVHYCWTMQCLGHELCHCWSGVQPVLHCP